MSRRQTHRAFSLVELLVVIAVIAIFAVFAVPAFNRIALGTDVTRAATLITDTIDGSRQLALARNQPVALVFYKYPSETSEPAAFRALQAFLWDPTRNGGAGDWIPEGRLSALPTNVTITADPRYSTLAADSPNPPANAPIVPRLASKNPSAAWFNFLPDGTPEGLAPGSEWTLTVIPENAPTTGGKVPSLPPNWIALSLDPINGTVQSFRP